MLECAPTPVFQKYLSPGAIAGRKSKQLHEGLRNRNFRNYPQDDRGPTARLGYIAWWVSNDMGPNTHHHFCRASSLRSCCSKVGKQGIVHVLRWTPITKSEGERALREWGFSPTLMSRARVFKPVTAGAHDEGEPHKPSSKSAPAALPRTPQHQHGAREERERSRSPVLRRSRRSRREQGMEADPGHDSPREEEKRRIPAHFKVILEPAPEPRTLDSGGTIAPECPEQSGALWQAGARKLALLRRRSEKINGSLTT